MASTTCEVFDFTLDVPEIDCELLMELLEESNGECDFVDHDHGNCEDCGLDDMLPDLDSHDCSQSSVMSDVMVAIGEPLDWVEMEVVASQDVGGWYMDEGGVFGYEEEQRYHEYCFNEDQSLCEQVYIPLWQ